MKRGILFALLISTLFLIACSNNIQKETYPPEIEPCINSLEKYDKIWKAKINVLFQNEVTWEEAILIIESYGLEKAEGQTPHVDPEKIIRRKPSELSSEERAWYEIMKKIKPIAKEISPEEKDAFAKQFEKEMTKLAEENNASHLNPFDPKNIEKNKEKAAVLVDMINEANKEDFEKKTHIMSVKVPLGKEKYTACTLKDEKIISAFPIYELDHLLEKVEY